MDIVSWEQRLADDGYRITASRRAVIQILMDTCTPLSPQQILDQAQKIHDQLGLVTVYRVINLLLTLRLVRRVHCEDGCHGYLPSSPGHHHSVICNKCGHSAEFSGENDLDELIHRVEMHTGYLVDNHLLQLSGLCPVCQHTSR